MKRYAAVAALLLLASCGGGVSEPDWSHVPQNQRVLIEEAVKAKDCTKMQTYFDASKRGDVLDYLDDKMHDAGCYK